MLPSVKEAEILLEEAENCNPGPWGNHSRVTAHCARKIAEACPALDPGKAYILGLLHDIGRKFGTRHLGHVSDGYTYMMSLGFDEAARVCLTHSFNNKTTDDYIGKFDTTAEELGIIQKELAGITYDEYDLLIQLCDSLAGAEGVMDMEERMADVKRRYGSYPQEKWDRNLEIRRYFEAQTGKDIYTVVEKDTFKPTAHRTIVRFYESVQDALLRFAVIIAKSNGKYVFCRHRDRDTWEVPGGHRECGESILDTAKRELYEETGALDFSIEPVCVYSVTSPDSFEGRESFGMLFYAEIRSFEPELHSEIEEIEITDTLPDRWTYPLIQPGLLQFAKEKGYPEAVPAERSF